MINTEKRPFFLSKEEYSKLPLILKNRLNEVDKAFDFALSVKAKGEKKAKAALLAFRILLDVALMYPKYLTVEMISAAAITFVEHEKIDFDRYKPLIDELIDAELDKDAETFVKSMILKIDEAVYQ
ncbi:MAG: hypothetical protein WC852_02960 [Candidatus Nanoarchaeia archaeon]|jgi:hypothetical protein